MRLKTKYSITTAILITLTVTLMSALLFYQFNNNAKRQQAVSTDAISDAILSQMIKRGEFIISYFSTSLNDDIYYENQKVITQALQASLQQQDVLFVEIFDPNGNIINDGSVEVWSYGQAVNDQQMLSALNQSDELYYRIEADKIIFARNIKIANERIASIHLGFSLLFMQDDILKTKAALHDQLNAMRKDDLQKNIFLVLLAAIMLIIIGISIAIITSNKLITPIQKLAGYARAAGKGEHQHELKLKGSDELEEVAAIFNTMNKRLLRSKQKMHHQAFHDHLTGLANRNLFHQHLDKALQIAANQKQQVAVLFLDLDGFKMVNDTYGHEAGDQLLITIANRFSGVIRKYDVLNFPNKQNNMLVSRIGGDEFCIILQDIDSKEVAAQIATRIIDSVAPPIELDKAQVDIGVSIGISIYPQDGDNGDTLLKNADDAMYQAKKSGKGHYVFYRY